MATSVSNISLQLQIMGYSKKKKCANFHFQKCLFDKNVYLSLLLSLPIIRYIVCKPSEPGQIVKSNSVS